MTVAEAEHEAPADFVRSIIRDDVAAGRTAEVVTRFPPEPNGYLHIGHAKSIVLNFGVAGEFGGRCHLRFDDTNPVKEETEFIDSIQADVRWLGYDWAEHLHFASDHFERLYEWAEHLVREGKAYVDDSSAEEIRAMRGTLTEPGTESPCRGRRPKKASTSCGGCGQASSRKAPACCAPGSTWRRATSICATRCSTGSCTPGIRAPATPGASTPPTISRTASPTRSRG